PVTEPATEPVTEPVTEPATEPVTEPATEPVTEPVTEPATEPVTEPVIEPVTEPATEPVTEPPQVLEEPDDIFTKFKNLVVVPEIVEPAPKEKPNTDARMTLEEHDALLASLLYKGADGYVYINGAANIKLP
ncbi:MAG: hypothetical protein IIX09_08990, partial [Clostridia bacterium]|nr:hypothetical protein [Clostridia bacterium]